MRFPDLGRKLNAEISQLLKVRISRNRSYYFFTLFADSNWRFHHSVITHWVGFTEDKPRREIREASLVNAPYILRNSRKAGRPVFVINSVAGLRFYLTITGGYALIQAPLARKYLTPLLHPRASIQLPEGGFDSISIIPPFKLRRRPTKKLRQQVLRRDNEECKICGASPRTNEHVTLELHHILPFSNPELQTRKI